MTDVNFKVVGFAVMFSRRFRDQQLQNFFRAAGGIFSSFGGFCRKEWVRGLW